MIFSDKSHCTDYNIKTEGKIMRCFFSPKGDKKTRIGKKRKKKQAMMTLQGMADLKGNFR